MKRFVLAIALAAMPAVLEAKESASFLQGTYSTEEGCQKLQALAAGTQPSLETVPDTLTPNGFKSWEGTCEFTKIFEHEPGKVYLGLMFCTEGESMTPVNFVFVKNDDGSFEVAATGQEAPEQFKRCAAGEEKK